MRLKEHPEIILGETPVKAQHRPKMEPSSLQPTEFEQMTPNDQMTLMGLVMTFAGTVLIPLADLRLKHGPPADQQAFAILFFVVFTALAIAAANEEANQKAVTKPTWQQWRQCHQLPQPRF